MLLIFRAVVVRVLVALVGLGSTFASAVELPAILSDGVVFQRGKPIRLWGTGIPHEKITVNWGDQRVSVDASDDGNWRVELAPVDHSFGDIVVSGSESQQQRIRAPIIGQVWVCGGQSNMAMPLAQTDGLDVAARPLSPPARLHLYRAPLKKGHPLEGRWNDDTPQRAAKFSAVCYMTGRMLAQHFLDAIGLIDSSIGGTRVEAWTPVTTPSEINTEELSQLGRKKRHELLNTAGSAFDVMVSPIAPLNAAGVILYQGEGNYRRNPLEYAERFVAAVIGWRAHFEQPNLPVYYVQLPHFPQAKPVSSWEEIRKQQARAEAMLPNLYMVASDGLTASEIHPKEKTEVARRLFTRISREGR